MPTTPLYRKIADQLRDAIFRGDLPPGSQLQTEPELQERYGVSRNTVRLAIRELIGEGLVETRGRRGTYVRERTRLDYHAARAERADRPLGESDAYFEEVRAAGHRPSQDFSMVIEPADAAVAARLRIPEGDLVVARSCLRYVDERVWSDQISYYPMDVSEAAGLTTPRDIPGGTIRAMAAVGFVEVGHIDELTTRMPTPEEARGLDIAPGVPVLVYYRTAWTNERPVRCTKTIFPGDRNRVIYELGDLPTKALSEVPA